MHRAPPRFALQSETLLELVDQVEDVSRLDRLLDELGHDRRKLLIWAAIASERRALENERRASPGRASEQRRLHLWMHEQSLRRLYRQSLATLTFVGRFLGYVQPEPERPRRHRKST